MAEYRIVRDNFCGYEVQARRWWFPLWLQCSFINTYRTIEDAERWAEDHSRKTVKYLGQLPRHELPQEKS